MAENPVDVMNLAMTANDQTETLAAGLLRRSWQHEFLRPTRATPQQMITLVIRCKVRPRRVDARWETLQLRERSRSLTPPKKRDAESVGSGTKSIKKQCTAKKPKSVANSKNDMDKIDEEISKLIEKQRTAKKPNKSVITPKNLK